MIKNIVGRYTILRKIGEGGMGEVYLAQDTELDRKIVLKFLPPFLSKDSDLNTRFKYEAKAAAAINHPNIITIYDIGEHEGQLFIAMEYIKGYTLGEILKKGNLSIVKILDITNQICEGLGEAHRNAIVHRDIKPDNILIDSDGRVKIADFGLAKSLRRTKLTKEGSLLGTIQYMSPEQLRGEDVDHRTDIWSVGVLLYEMIAGRGPFIANTDMELTYLIIHEDPEPLIRYKTGISDNFQRIINKALDKDLNKRYQSLTDLKIDLKREQKEINSTIKTKYKKKISLIRHRVLYKIMIALIALFSIVAVYILLQKSKNNVRIPIAVVDFVNDTGEKELNGLSGMLITALEQSQRLSVLTRTRMFDILRQIDRGEIDQIDVKVCKEICEYANVKLMAIASIKKFGHVYSIDLKLVDSERDKYIFATTEKGEGQEIVPHLIDNLASKTRKALKEKKATINANSDKIAVVTTPNLDAWQHYFQGEQLIHKLKMEEAEEEFKKAITLDSTFGLAYYRLAYTKFWFRFDHGIKTEPIKNAIKLINRIPKKERLILTAVKAGMEGNYDKQLSILRKAEQLYPDDKEILFSIGDAYHHTICNDEAIHYFKKVLTIDSTHLRALDHLADIYTRIGYYEEAERLFLKALKIDPGNIFINLSYAWNLQYQQKYDLAEDLYRQADLAEIMNEDLHRYYSGLGWLLLRQAKYSESEQVFLKALDIGKDKPSDYNGLVKIKIQKKDYVAAQKYNSNFARLSKEFPEVRNRGNIFNGMLKLLQSEYDSSEYYLKLVLYQPDNQNYLVYALQLLAYLSCEQEQFSNAYNFITKALEIDSSFLSINLEAWILIAGNIDLDTGIELARQASQMEPDPTQLDDPRIYSFQAIPEYSLGLAYLKKEQYKLAVDYLEKASLMAPERKAVKNNLQIAKQKLAEFSPNN